MFLSASVDELSFITAGPNQARRGWLTATDVLNTLPLAALLKTLTRKRDYAAWAADGQQSQWPHLPSGSSSLSK